MERSNPMRLPKEGAAALEHLLHRFPASTGPKIITLTLIWLARHTDEEIAEVLRGTAVLKRKAPP